MKNVALFSVKNSLFVNILSAVIVFAGIISIFSIKREAFPPVSYDIVTITTPFRGAPAEKVETLVTAPIERELREVDDLEDIFSDSIEGISTIFVKISIDAKDKARVLRNINNAVDRVTNLPDDVDERPRVDEMTSGMIPVIKVAVSGDVDEFVLRDYADKLYDKFEEIDGVSSVKKVGWRDEEYWVQPDIKKMNEYHISFRELANILGEQNVESPGGKLKTEKEEYIVKVTSEFLTKEDIENTVVRANDNDDVLLVKDIAQVKHTFEDDLVVNKVLGNRAISLVVIKRERGDIINVVRNVNQIIKEERKIIPANLKISNFYDMSYYVQRRLNVLSSNGVVGFILVLIILFIFLHPVPAVLTAAGIPIAMFTTLAVMYVSGMTINLITMFGLIIVLGMLVDDGIIISENVYRYIEKGYSPREAAIKGSSEVMLPVLATVITTIAAFAPLLFMKGLLGRYIRDLPLVAIIALLASLLEAFFILPSHLADFSHRIRYSEEKHIKLKKKKYKWFRALRLNYYRLINLALRNKYRVVLGLWLTFLVSLVVAFFFMKFVLFSSEGIEQFSIVMEAKLGTRLEETNLLISDVEKMVEAMPKKYVDTYETLVGKIATDDFDPYSKQAGHFAQINVYLTPLKDRGKSAAEIIQDYRPKLNQVYERLKEQGVLKLHFEEYKEGPPVGKPVDIAVRGEDFSMINEIAGKIKSYLASLKGIEDIKDTYSLGTENINVVIDEKKAREYYLTNNDIAFAIRSAFAGSVATTIKRSKADKEINVLVRLPQEQRDNLDVFKEIYVRNRYDNLIPLSKVIKTANSQSLLGIGHISGKRYVAVTAEVDNKNMTSLKANHLLKKEIKDVSAQYPGYSLRFFGEDKETMDSLRSLFQAFLIAFFIVFLILATQFQSLIQPFIVLHTIPFGLIGVIFGFLIHGESLGFLAILGLVGLTGVVVNDSIVLVDFINGLRKKGMPIQRAIARAGLLRFRPVILTTVTTVAGLGTVAYGVGGFDPFLRPMALAISWGLLFSTFLTLVVLPCVYSIVEELKVKLISRFLKKNIV